MILYMAAQTMELTAVNFCHHLSRHRFCRHLLFTLFPLIPALEAGYSQIFQTQVQVCGAFSIAIVPDLGSVVEHVSAGFRPYRLFRFIQRPL